MEKEYELSKGLHTWFWCQQVLQRLLWALVLWFFLHSVYVCAVGFSTPKRTADVAVILGTTVHPTGAMSSWLEARLQRGLQLYQQGQVQNVLVSANGIQEARAMRQYLLAHGVNGTDIWVDETGHSTALSAQHAATMMQNQAWTHAIVVSQFFHVSRGKMLLQKAGITEVETASPEVFSPTEFTALAKEWVAYYVYWSGLKVV